MCVERERKGDALTQPLLGFISPHRTELRMFYVGERGGTSKPGRAFSLRSDRAESSRGVGPPAAEKENPPFFIVKDAVECDGLISNEPGRGISERKGPTRV